MSTELDIKRLGYLGLGIIGVGLLLFANGNRIDSPVGTEDLGDSEPSLDADAASGLNPSSDARAMSEAEEPLPPPADARAPVVEAPVSGAAPLTSASPALPAREPTESGSTPDRLPNVRERLDQLIGDEAIDPDWSDGMESRILSELSLLPGLTATLIEVDCRTLHCAINVTLPREAPAGQPDLVAITENGRPVFVAEAALELETVAILNLRNENGLPTFFALLRRAGDSTTQSIAPVATIA
jgi:hypothetical protein